MKKLSLLELSVMTLVGAAALVSACGSDDAASSGGAGAGGSHAGTSGSAGSSGSSGSAGTAGTSGSAGTSGAGAGGTSAGGSSGAGAGGDAAAGAAGAGSGGAAGATSTMFTVTLENVAQSKLFTSAGVFNTPVGDAAAGPATPGKMYQFTVDAGRKQKLSFATMLAATNDLFFGPDGNGIALYDAGGAPISADVTSQIHL